jgi:hypothetical protein
MAQFTQKSLTWNHQVSQSQKNLIFHNRSCFEFHQAQWTLFLSQLQFVITYHPRHQERKLNTLLCHLYLAPKEGDEIYNQQRDIIFKLKHFLLQALCISNYKKLKLQMDNVVFQILVYIPRNFLINFLNKEYTFKKCYVTNVFK